VLSIIPLREVFRDREMEKHEKGASKADPNPSKSKSTSKSKQTVKEKGQKHDKGKSDNVDKIDSTELGKHKAKGQTSSDKVPQSQPVHVQDQNKEAGSSSNTMAPMLKTLMEENKKLLSEMMSSLREEFAQTSKPHSSTVSEEEGLRRKNRSGKFDYGDDDSDIQDNPKESGQDSLVLHPDYANEGLDEVGLESNVSQADDDSASKSGDLDAISNTDTSHTDFSSDVQWVSVLKQLPQYYDGALALESESSKSHTSYVSSTFQMGKKNPVPKLPLEGDVKDRWDSVEKFMSKGSVSAFRASDAHKFRIYESDFDKYGCVPTIDQEYKAKVEIDTQKFSKNVGGKKSKQPTIKDPKLRQAEYHFQKCDESARVALRASSHGILMLNAMNTILEDPNKYEQGEMVNLVKGSVRCLQAVTDCAVRVTARSVLARREICLSQINFKDSNATKDLMSLPMGGKHLFQDKFSETMHKYATFSRDARETSDYASGHKRSFNSQGNSGPATKKHAPAALGAPRPAEPQVQVQGQKRTISFKDGTTPRPFRGRGRGSRFQFQRRQSGKPPGSGQQY